MGPCKEYFATLLFDVMLNERSLSTEYVYTSNKNQMVMKIVRMPGDGRCMYHSVAYHLKSDAVVVMNRLIDF